MTAAGPGRTEDDRRDSSTPWRRDPQRLASALSAWASERLGWEQGVTGCGEPANGMANDTLLFDVGDERLVARLAPEADSPYPTFPTFDLGLQHDTMQLVRRTTSVPVPEIVTLENDSRWLGTPFLVMRHVEGKVPADRPPYLAKGWMTKLSDAELAEMEERTVSELAAIHTVDDAGELARFARPDLGRSPLDQQLAAQLAYYHWARDGQSVPVLEEAIAALSATVPAGGRLTLNWGDSRIGNIIYQGVRPAAILDWEMATAGPPEVDVAWMIFMHRFFQEMVTSYGVRGLPGFLASDRVVSLYQRAADMTLDDLAWYEAFAGLRFGIITYRMNLRSIRFGGPGDLDDADGLVMFAPLLRTLLGRIR